MNFKHSIIAVALFSGVFHSQAQQSIGLKQAIDYALENKADAQKANLKITNAEYQIAEAKSGALPTISGSGGLTYNPILQQSALPGDMLGRPGETILVPFGKKWGATVGVSVQQALFNQKVFIGLKAAKTTKEFYQINKQLTDETLIENVSTAYYQVFTQKEKLKTTEISYESMKKVRNIIKSMFENGLAKKVDLDRSNVNLTNLETSKIQLKNAVSLAENSLKFYMGMPIETPISLIDADVQTHAPLLDETISTDNRTELLVLDKQKTMLGYNVKATEAAYYPTLNLVGNYAWQGMGDKMPIGMGKSQGVYWTDNANIGLQLNIPIFNGFQTKAKVDQAKIELASLEQDIKETKLSLDLQYQNAKSQMENNWVAIQNQEANVKLAETVLSNTKSNYQYGLAPLTDLLDAENSLVQAKNNYSTAVLDYKIAEIQMYKSKGELQNLRK